ncbi:MAG TPA: hypothetical protein VGA92_00520 [Candidatus Nitrosotenuis sp.]
MRFSNKDVETRSRLLKKMEEDRKHEKIRIGQRRKAQLRGKTISRITQKRRKYTVRRKAAKKKSSVR